jgi:hypothetical protein
LVVGDEAAAAEADEADDDDDDDDDEAAAAVFVLDLPALRLLVMDKEKVVCQEGVRKEGVCHSATIKHEEVQTLKTCKNEYL